MKKLELKIKGTIDNKNLLSVKATNISLTDGGKEVKMLIDEIMMIYKQTLLSTTDKSSNVSAQSQQPVSNNEL